jgi:hypothetical protein
MIKIKKMPQILRHFFYYMNKPLYNAMAAMDATIGAKTGTQE